MSESPQQILPNVTRRDGVEAYSWITVDSDGDQIEVIWLFGDYGLLLSTRPSGEHWSAPTLMDKQRWSVSDRSLETAQRVVEEFLREVAWKR